MPIGGKEGKKSMDAPVLDLMQARVAITDLTLYDEPYEVERKSDGQKFPIDPNLNAKITIVDDQEDGEADGQEFWEKFNLKQSDDGKWIIRDGTKLGALAKAFYGKKFFDKDNTQIFDEAELEGFEFMAKVEPKHKYQSTEVIGSMLNHETIMSIPTPKEKKKAADKKAAGDKEAESLTTEDFDDLPF